MPPRRLHAEDHVVGTVEAATTTSSNTSRNKLNHSHLGGAEKVLAASRVRVEVPDFGNIVVEDAPLAAIAASSARGGVGVEEPPLTVTSPRRSVDAPTVVRQHIWAPEHPLSIPPRRKGASAASANVAAAAEASLVHADDPAASSHHPRRRSSTTRRPSDVSLASFFGDNEIRAAVEDRMSQRRRSDGSGGGGASTASSPQRVFFTVSGAADATTLAAASAPRTSMPP